MRVFSLILSLLPLLLSCAPHHSNVKPVYTETNYYPTMGCEGLRKERSQLNKQMVDLEVIVNSQNRDDVNNVLNPFYARHGNSATVREYAIVKGRYEGVNRELNKYCDNWGQIKGVGDK